MGLFDSAAKVEAQTEYYRQVVDLNYRQTKNGRKQFTGREIWEQYLFVCDLRTEYMEAFRLKLREPDRPVVPPVDEIVPL
ncbi:hypothetical protein [Curtobacterium sp. GD1]|uniref:hypothetical protein n=1 Tax=Curtobacterium sp. GD1 TaxID=2810612 RepID=UPI001E424FEB|nr:hypothetical protein [Curtobacterium sp. GD1]MCC8907755.1 hypothetical protein [Curtobacterium sp. GD1]